MERDCHRLDYGHGGDGGGGCKATSSSKSKRKANAANGCMAAFYHLFDFQHFITIDSPSRSKGLKLIEETLPSTTYKDKQSLNIPVSMRVRTETGAKSSRLRALATDTSTSSSEICNSSGSTTPNLVARLMGLDLLPDKTYLNHSLSNLHTMWSHHGSNRLTSHRLSKKGTRSLPVSPRISSARKSDFDIHRLSLQLNKENNRHEDQFGCSRLKEMKQDKENQSPRDYARQIVKQIKERVVTRRVVGMDITNLVRSREARPLQHELRRDTTVSCSPRTRFSDKENKPSNSHKPNSSSSFRPEQIIQNPKPTTVIVVSVSKSSGDKQSQNRVKQRQVRPINQCKKAESEARFIPRPIKSSQTPDIRLKKQETFLSESRDVKAKPLHKKKLKKIPKLNDLENISATRPPQKQINERVRVKSNKDALICSSLMHKVEKNSPQVTRNHKLDDAATVLEGIKIDSEKDYITRIVNLAGIQTDSPTTMFSSSHSLTNNTSLFRKLEHEGDYPSGSLALQCNRKLLFDLVNELYANRRGNYHDSELISELCSAVSRYSSKCCPVPEEIALMDVDHLLVTKKMVEEEGEGIVAEVEREIIDALVQETVSELSLIT